jgi:Uma2 family endonuclease
MTLWEYRMTPKTLLPQELVRGAVRVADAPSVHHQRILFSIARALQVHTDARFLGEVLIAPVDVVLDEDLVVQPDLLFVSTSRASLVRDKVYGPPDLVLEVLSPEPRIGSLEERVDWFASYGVHEIWLYDQPTRAMHILTCEQRDVVSRRRIDHFSRVRSRLLPHFTPVLSRIVGGWY